MSRFEKLLEIVDRIEHPTDIAYLAGLFDGEGSISASPSPKTPDNFRIIISVAMCDTAGVEMFATVFGGQIRTEKRVTKAGKPVYTWTLYCQKAADALERMLPYLRIKRTRAENAILLARMMDRRNATICRDGGEIIDLDQRLELASMIRAENLASNGRIQNAVKKGKLAGSDQFKHKRDDF